MHPSHHARATPDKPAFIMAASGDAVTYAQLEARSNQGAHLFRSLGLKTGDGVCFFLDNGPRYYELLWAAQRAGLRFTCVSSKLTPGEVDYIVNDSESKLFVASKSLGEIASKVQEGLPNVQFYMVDGTEPGFLSFEDARAPFPEVPIEDESAGAAMLYSSGTTGRPKGVRRVIDTDAAVDAPPPLAGLGAALYGMNADTVYLSPAPLYHAAPLGWSMAVQSLGGTVVLMERFDAEKALEYIQTYKITVAQWVPTHFVRMLKLPAEVRARYDMSSLKAVFHAAAPCPIPVKSQMIEWWGPIIHEYYAGTEGNGFTAITAQEWLTHKGSVGRGLTAEVKICSEDGEVLPARAEGLVYFAGGGKFEYHNDPEKTAQAQNEHGWSTLGDVGYLDEDGYLYLTDRKSFMIISGGVNIYPAEIENLLITHAKVADVAVVGAPHEEMGEEVIAVVQPALGIIPDEALAAELIAFARESLSHVKTPRRVDFTEELPRHATGKLYKRLIRDAYWAKGPVAAGQEGR